MEIDTISNPNKNYMRKKKKKLYEGGTSLVVQWLRLRTSTAGASGSIPGWGTKIPHAAWYGQQNKTKKLCEEGTLSLSYS